MVQCQFKKGEKFMIVIDKNSKKPLYLQIYEQFYDQIQKGEIAPGDTLIATRVLANELGISRNTVDQAYSQLVLEGLVTSKRGSGYKANTPDGYVSNDSSKKKINFFPQKDKNIIFDLSWRIMENSLFRRDLWRHCITHSLTILENRELLNTPSRDGEPFLQEAIAKTSYLFRKVSLLPHQVILTPDNYEAVTIICDLFDPQEYTALLFNPSHPALKELFTRNGFKISYVDLINANINIKELYNHKKALLFIMPNHSFPTGDTLPHKLRTQLVEWAKDTNSYIIEDDSTNELLYAPNPLPSLKSYDTENRVFYTVTYANTLSPGSRLAFLGILPQFYEKYNKLYHYYINPVPLINQYALTEYIEKKYLARHIRRYKTLNKKKNELLLETLEKYFGNDIIINGKDAGVFVTLSPKNNMTEDQLVTSALKIGLKVYPVAQYYNNGTKPENPTVIMGYGSLSLNDIEKCVALLYKAWFKY